MSGAPAIPEWDIILSYAHRNNAEGIISLVEDQGVDPSHGNAVGQTALHIAALWGNIESVKVLLSLQANINAQNSFTGATPIHSSIQSNKTPPMNRVECVRLMVEGGADVFIKDNFEQTPLDSLYAEKERAKERDNSLDNVYVTAMEQVLMSGDKDTSFLLPLVSSMDLDGLQKLMVENTGMDLEERDNRAGMTPLILAVDKLLGLIDEDELEDDNIIQALEGPVQTLVAIIKLLLEKGADANAIPNKNLEKGSTEIASKPLYLICDKLSACSSSDTSIQDSLMDVAFDLFSHGAELSNPIIGMMHNAARRGHLGFLKFGVEKLAVDPNTRGRQGMTALHFAARSGSTSIVEWLLAYQLTDGRSGVDVSVVDDRGKTALDAAAVNNKEAIVKLLEDHAK